MNRFLSHRNIWHGIWMMLKYVMDMPMAGWLILYTRFHNSDVSLFLTDVKVAALTDKFVPHGRTPLIIDNPTAYNGRWVLSKPHSSSVSLHSSAEASHVARHTLYCTCTDFSGLWSTLSHSIKSSINLLINHDSHPRWLRNPYNYDVM